MHKLSVPCNQKKFSVPNLKRMSIPASAAGVNNKHSPAALKATGNSSRTRLAESESYEGPNYFLSRVAPPVRNEHSTQTAAHTYDQRHPLAAYSNPYQYHNKSVAKAQPFVRASMASNTSTPPVKASTIAEGERSPGGKKLPEEGDPPGSDRMQRRQTLVNLETAKFRFLAAEMAHKRVLERSGEGTRGKSKKGSKKASGSKKAGSAALKQHKSPKSPLSPRSPSTKRPQPPNGIAPPLSPPRRERSRSPPVVAPPVPTQPQQPIAPQVQQQQPPVRGLEPSKVVPLLIARNLVSQSDGGPLSAVPEEGIHEVSFTPSPPPVTVQSSPPVRRKTATGSSTSPIVSDLAGLLSPVEDKTETESPTAPESQDTPDNFVTVAEDQQSEGPVLSPPPLVITASDNAVEEPAGPDSSDCEK